MKILLRNIEHVYSKTPVADVIPAIQAKCAEIGAVASTWLDNLASAGFGEEMAVAKVPALCPVTSADTSMNHLMTVERAAHDTTARMSAKTYWRSARVKKEQENLMGRSKFETCAFLQAERVPTVSTSSKDQALACLTSSMSSAHSQNVINGYVGRNK